MKVFTLGSNFLHNQQLLWLWQIWDLQLIWLWQIWVIQLTWLWQIWDLQICRIFLEALSLLVLNWLVDRSLSSSISLGQEDGQFGEWSLKPSEMLVAPRIFSTTDNHLHPLSPLSSTFIHLHPLSPPASTFTHCHFHPLSPLPSTLIQFHPLHPLLGQFFVWSLLLLGAFGLLKIQAKCSKIGNLCGANKAKVHIKESRQHISQFMDQP